MKKIFISILLIVLGFWYWSAPPEPQVKITHIKDYSQVEVRQSWGRKSIDVVIDSSVYERYPNVERKLLRAFQVWRKTGANLPAIYFFKGEGISSDIKPDGVNAVVMGSLDEIDFSESGIHGNMSLAVTMTFSNPKTNMITEADIIINENKNTIALNEKTSENFFSCSGSVSESCAAYDLESVLVHEVGHFYGLDEDMTNPSSSMYHCTSPCETHKRTLSKPDIDAIVSLYSAYAK